MIIMIMIMIIIIIIIIIIIMIIIINEFQEIERLKYRFFNSNNNIMNFRKLNYKDIDF